MTTVWRIEYDPGTGPEVIEFSRFEAAQLRRLLNCEMDVQRYKSGLSCVYYAPHSYYSGTFVFRLETGTYEKVCTLAAVRVPVKVYYRYHVAAATFIWANIVPVKEDAFVSGYLSAEDISIQFIETVEPGS